MSTKGVVWKYSEGCIEGVSVSMGKNTKQLSAQYLIKVAQLFEKKNWEIENSEEMGNSLFDRYCQRLLEVGENAKRELMLELTERYLWISDEDYVEHLIQVLVKLVTENKEISEDSKIYVMPLIAPDDMGKTKSSVMLSYLFNSVRLRHNKKLSKYKFQLENNIDQVVGYLKQDNCFLILADDFIGTGETAEKCIVYMQEKSVPIEKIIILSLVAQEKGLEYLKKYSVYLVANIIQQRGISDYYEGEQLKGKISLMLDIEKKMSIKKKYRLGYNGSEALVTMCRTPNNTFPLFWDETGNMKIAPFPRL